MKKIITIIFILSIAFLTVQKANAALVVTGDCNYGTFTLSAKAKFAGTDYTWFVIKDGVIIKQVAGARNFSTDVNLLKKGVGIYSLKVHYYYQGVLTKEFGNDVPVPAPNYATIVLDNISTSDNILCSSADTIIRLQFPFNTWDEATINIYATTGFGGAKGALLKTITQSNPDGNFYLDNRNANKFLNSGEYVLVTVNCSSICTIGNELTLYFYDSPSCRVGTFLDNSTEVVASYNGINLYPNPVENTLNVQGDLSEVSKLELYSSHGLLVETYSGSYNAGIDFSDKKSGVYFVKIYKNDGSVKTTKVARK